MKKDSNEVQEEDNESSSSFTILYITMVLGGLAWSVTAFAYMHSNFPSKEYLDLILKRVDRIEMKIDKLLEKEY